MLCPMCHSLSAILSFVISVALGLVKCSPDVQVPQFLNVRWLSPHLAKLCRNLTPVTSRFFATLLRAQRTREQKLQNALILNPHCTHALQGLDVVCFAKLKKEFYEEIRHFEDEHHTPVTKGDFAGVDTFQSLCSAISVQINLT
jgi:hypothetical protein